MLEEHPADSEARLVEGYRIEDQIDPGDWVWIDPVTGAAYTQAVTS
jgi:hypothetical protein